jgi:hypothetical protein
VPFTVRVARYSGFWSHRPSAVAFHFFSSASHNPLRVRFFALAFFVIFSLAVIAYGFLVRRKYNIYLRDRSEVAPNI